VYLSSVLIPPYYASGGGYVIKTSHHMLSLVLVMRLVVIGCEYAGKSTFLQKVLEWGRAHHIHFHVDDHFTVPDASLTDEDRDIYVTLPPMIKERYQRFQIWYHVRLLNTFDDMVAVGFHIEEVIYDPIYFHFTPHINPREVEASLPSDTILLLLRASPDRRQTSPRYSPSSKRSTNTPLSHGRSPSIQQT